MNDVPRHHLLSRPAAPRRCPARRPRRGLTLVELVVSLANDLPQLFDSEPYAKRRNAMREEVANAQKARLRSFEDDIVALLRRMLALRIHLDDAGSDNGALRIIPGSHQRGLMSGDQLRASARHGVDLPAQAGQVIAMRPLLAHASRPSQRPQHRRVIHIECAGETLPPPLQWLEAA